MLPVIGMSASDFLKQGATAAPAGARPPPESAVASCVASAGGSHAEAARLAVARRHEATPEAPPQPTVSAQPVGSSAAAFLASKESRDDQESDPLPPEAPDEEQPQSTEKPLGSSAAAFLASSDAPTAPEKPTGSSAAAFLASSDDPQAPEQPSGSSAAAFLASSDSSRCECMHAMVWKAGEVLQGRVLSRHKAGAAHAGVSADEALLPTVT